MPVNPSCCSSPPPTIPTFSCPCPTTACTQTFLIKNFSYRMFTRPGSALFTTSTSANADHGEFQHAPHGSYCWTTIGEIFCGMTPVGGFIDPMYGLRRVATDAGCTNKFWVLEIYVWDPTFTTKILVWQGIQIVANVAEDGAPYIRVAGTSLIPASVELFCADTCGSKDDSTCATTYTVTLTLRAGGTDVLGLGLVPGGSIAYPVRSVGPGSWIWAAFDSPQISCDRGRAVVNFGGEIWAKNTTGQVCPPLGDYPPLSTGASNYDCVVS